MPLLIVLGLALLKIEVASGDFRRGTEIWDSALHRTTRDLAINDMVLLVPFVFVAYWPLQKVMTSRIEAIVSILAALIVGWFAIG